MTQRAEFGPHLSFVIARISETPAATQGAVVRAAQEAVAAAVPNTAIFSTSDYGLIDDWHYDLPGMVSLGERFAARMLSISKKADVDKNGEIDMLDYGLLGKYWLETDCR